MKIFKPEKTSVILPALLTNEQRSFGAEQNQELLNYIKKTDLFKDYNNISLSRDKKNHILVLCYNNDIFGNMVCCFMLGLDTKTNELHFHKVGYINYNIGRFYRSYLTRINHFIPNSDYGELSFEYNSEYNPGQNPNNCLYISYLEVEQEFNRLGIGDVLLQTAENLTKDKNLECMVLVSLMSHSPLDSAQPQSDEQKSLLNTLGHKEELTKHDRKLLKGAENRKFIADSYFDKNFFLYSTHGFYPYMMGIHNSIENVAHNLMKNDIVRVDTSLGLSKTTEYTPADFKINKLTKHEAIKHLRTTLSTFYNSSSASGGVFAVDFSPFEISMDKEGSEFLQEILNNLTLEKSHKEADEAPPSGKYSDFANSEEFRDMLNDLKEQ